MSGPNQPPLQAQGFINARAFRNIKLGIVDGDRSCKGCTACCWTHSIPDYKPEPKPMCSKCPSNHYGRKCRIYKDRPQSCRDFNCLWLHGFGVRWHKPDNSGVVVGASMDFTINKVKVAAFQFHEVKQGAARHPRWEAACEEWLRMGIPVIIIEAEGRRRARIPNRITSIVPGQDEALVEALHSRTATILGGAAMTGQA